MATQWFSRVGLNRLAFADEVGCVASDMLTVQDVECSKLLHDRIGKVAERNMDQCFFEQLGYFL